METSPSVKVEPRVSSRPGTYCIRLHVSAADRENAWELFRIAVLCGGTQICGCYFAFADEERRSLVSAMVKRQFGAHYVEELDADPSGIDSRLLIATRSERLIASCWRHFSQRGYLVSAAVDGVECMEVVRQWRPDVLVLRDDILWGGSGGVLECMRQDPELADVRVVLIANHRSARHHVIRSAGPAVAVLWEPIVMDGLLNTVEFVASLKRPWR